MIDLHYEVLRTLACPGIVVNRLAAQLSEPTPVEDVIVPLTDLVAAGLAERFWDRGNYRYRLSTLGQAVYVRLLRRDQQQFVVEARLQVPAYTRVCPAHAVQPTHRRLTLTMNTFAAPKSFAEFAARYPRFIAGRIGWWKCTVEEANAYLAGITWLESHYNEHTFLQWLSMRVARKFGSVEPINPSPTWLAHKALVARFQHST